MIVRFSKAAGDYNTLVSFKVT